MPAPLLVIAGDRDQYVYYCHEHGLNPRRDARYVRDLQDVRGLGDNIQFTFYGTWDDRRAGGLDDALNYLRHLERQGRARRVDDLGPVVDEVVPREPWPGPDAFSMRFESSSGEEPV